jgi:hypothetical protein
MHRDETTCEIFVNRRRMLIAIPSPTGAQIAALLGVPPDNAVVEREDGKGGLEMLAIDAPFNIEPGQSFLVTRQFIMGGHGESLRHVPRAT